MYILVSTYTEPTEVVNTRLDAHRAWLVGHYRSGRILVSGRRNPPMGGVIVVRAESAEEVAELLADDPYVRDGLVSYEVIAFDETPLPHRSPAVEAFLAEPIGADR